MKSPEISRTACRVPSCGPLFARLPRSRARAPAAAAVDVPPLVRAINAVGPKGVGHPAAVAASQQLGQADAGQIPEILAGMDESSRLSANWLRGAVEAIAQRELDRGGQLPLAALETFLADAAHLPQARSLAYDLILRVDPAAKPRWVPRLLQDPSMELRREGVAFALSEAKKLLDAKRAAASDRSLSPSTDRGSRRGPDRRSRQTASRTGRDRGRGVPFRLPHPLATDRPVREHRRQRIRRSVRPRTGCGTGGRVRGQDRRRQVARPHDERRVRIGGSECGAGQAQGRDRLRPCRVPRRRIPRGRIPHGLYHRPQDLAERRIAHGQPRLPHGHVHRPVHGSRPAQVRPERHPVEDRPERTDRNPGRRTGNSSFASATSTAPPSCPRIAAR